MTNSLTKYDINNLLREFEEYLNQKSIEQNIPSSIFSEKLTPFESAVKFLIENKKINYSEIGRILQKDRQVIWITYKRTAKKVSSTFKNLDFTNSIPLQKLSSNKYSIAELIVAHFKELNLKNSDIAKILKKDPKTIWTFYNRYKRKGGQK